MRVAYVMPHSYEYLFPNEIAKMNSPDEFDTSIMAKSDNCENKYCKASLIVGIEPVFYYLSSTARSAAGFTHRDGYTMKRVPIDLKRRGYGKYGWELSFRLLNELSNDAIDAALVFTYALNPLLPLDMYDLLAIGSKVSGYPMVARHGGDSARCLFLGKRSVPGRALTKKTTLRMAARIVLASRSEYLFLSRDMKLERGKLVFLQDPVDLGRFRAGLSREAACRRLDKDPNRRYVLYVGRLVFPKGIQHLLNVMPRIKKVYKNVSLLIVGYGELEKPLKRLVEQLGLRDEVSFEGLVLHDLLPMYYSLADVFVLPSHDESAPNVLQEAVACNVPCVSTTVGGIPYILRDNLGILVEPGDEGGLFQAIMSVLDGKFKPNQEARKKLLNEWEITNFGQKLRVLWEQVASP
jgi:glycosyltransferase involved in cell wall biosynthesis